MKTCARLLCVVAAILIVPRAVTPATADDDLRRWEQQMRWQRRYLDSTVSNYQFSGLGAYSPAVSDLRLWEQQMRWQASYLDSTSRMTDLGLQAGARSRKSGLGYGYDFALDTSFHGLSWTSSDPRILPGLVDTFGQVGARLHTQELGTRLSRHGLGALPTWYEPSLSEIYASRISRVTSPILTTALTIGSAGQTFLETADYVGRSMQILNPPRPDTRIAFPDMNLKPGATLGEGLHNLRTWTTDIVRNRVRPVQFETLRTIPVREEIDLGTTRVVRSGFLRDTQMTVTPTTGIERFMLRLYPVGSYFDPMTSTTIWRREWSVTTRETTGLRARIEPSRLERIGGIGPLSVSMMNTRTPSFLRLDSAIGSRPPSLRTWDELQGAAQLGRLGLPSLYGIPGGSYVLQQHGYDAAWRFAQQYQMRFQSPLTSFQYRLPSYQYIPPPQPIRTRY